MPRHLISDAHEWINEIPTVPIYLSPRCFNLMRRVADAESFGERNLSGWYPALTGCSIPVAERRAGNRVKRQSWSEGYLFVGAFRLRR